MKAICTSWTSRSARRSTRRWFGQLARRLLLVLCCLGGHTARADEQSTCTIFSWVTEQSGPSTLREWSNVVQLQIGPEFVSGVQNGASFRLPRRSVWRIEWSQSGQAVLSEDKPHLLQLGRDDRWTFEAVTFQGDVFRLEHRQGRVSVEFPLEQVAAVFWDRPRYGMPVSSGMMLVSPNTDRVQLKNGDELQGTLGALNNTGLTIEAGFGDLKIPLSQLRELRLDPQLLAVARVPESAVVVALGDGTVTTSSDVRYDGSSENVSVSLPGKQQIELPLSEVRSLTFVSSQSRPLTWLPVLESTQESYFGRRSPVLQGASALGTPLVVQGTTYSLGLGVRSGSRITVELPAGAEEFWCVTGLDALARDRGAVTIRITGQTAGGDLQVVLPELALSVANSPLQIGPLDLRGLKTLTLETNYGPRADVLDVIDWCLPTVRIAAGP